MSGERWRNGWQEETFARVRGFIQSSPAWYQNLSPSDVAEDAYLLTIASTLFLRDGDSVEGKGSAAPRSGKNAGNPSAPKLAIPAFSYEKAASNDEESMVFFAQANSGTMGTLHRNAAQRAGSAEGWRSALKALQTGGALRTGFLCDASKCSPAPATLQEDLNDCVRAVLRKSLHAFKIGFGLWGRWEAP
jgi:hypothetical protein